MSEALTLLSLHRAARFASSGGITSLTGRWPLFPMRPRGQVVRVLFLGIPSIDLGADVQVDVRVVGVGGKIWASAHGSSVRGSVPDGQHCPAVEGPSRAASCRDGVGNILHRGVCRQPEPVDRQRVLVFALKEAVSVAPSGSPTFSLSAREHASAKRIASAQAW